MYAHACQYKRMSYSQLYVRGLAYSHIKTAPVDNYLVPIYNEIRVLPASASDVLFRAVFRLYTLKDNKVCISKFAYPLLSVVPLY